MMNVTDRLWINFEVMIGLEFNKNSFDCVGKDIKKWTFCNIPINEYIKRAEWIDENISNDVDINIKTNFDNVFIFVDDADAMAFKLRWI